MKKGGLLEKLTHNKEGICATCGHVIEIGSTLGYGCESHDKLILASFPPYHDEKQKCNDWKAREPNEI